VYSRKLRKKKTRCRKKPDFGSGSWLRMGKVFTPHNAHPKRVPLIKRVGKVFWFFGSNKD